MGRNCATGVTNKLAVNLHVESGYEVECGEVAREYISVMPRECFNSAHTSLAGQWGAMAIGPLGPEIQGERGDDQKPGWRWAAKQFQNPELQVNREP